MLKSLLTFAAIICTPLVIIAIRMWAPDAFRIAQEPFINGDATPNRGTHRAGHANAEYIDADADASRQNASATSSTHWGTSAERGSFISSRPRALGTMDRRSLDGLATWLSRLRVARDSGMRGLTRFNHFAADRASSRAGVDTGAPGNLARNTSRN
jgi:hypothetical protein